MRFEELPAVNQGNLVKLQRYMMSTYGDTRFDSHFKMNLYQNSFRWIDKHCCGTSACLLGHGPMAGIPVKDCHLDWKGRVDWNDYSNDITGIGRDSATWKFLFDHKWTNDIQEAIARLTMYIDGSDPEREEWYYEDTYTK